MNICFNALLFNKLRGTGIYTYTYNLIYYLGKYYPQAKYYVLWDPAYNIHTWFLKQNVNFIEETTYESCSRTFPKVFKYINGKKTPIFHCMNNGFTLTENHRSNDVLKKDFKYIVSVHDLIAVTNGELVDTGYLNYFNRLFSKSTDRADKIIATSGFIKDDLMKYFKIDSGKIEVINPICSEIFRPMNKSLSVDFIRQKYNINDGFLLFCGSIHIRKNLDMLIRVFNMLRRETKDLKLVIVGKTYGKRTEYFLGLKKICRELNISDDIIFTGIVDYHDMPYFYNGAKLVLDFSIYEGFPMSAVEALCCGTYVVCNNTPFFRETIGEYAVLVNIHSHSYSEVKDIILSVIQDGTPKKTMHSNSLTIGEKYSPRLIVKQLVSLYEGVLY